jgi:hypothetical protein
LQQNLSTKEWVRELEVEQVSISEVLWKEIVLFVFGYSDLFIPLSSTSVVALVFIAFRLNGNEFREDGLDGLIRSRYLLCIKIVIPVK